MRKILIVGAGQSGLQLALTLLEHDYDVTVMSARTPDEIRSGRVMSTQCMFDRALQHERDHQLNFWEEPTTDIVGLGISLGTPEGERELDWWGVLDNYAQSVDQRVKMAYWLEQVEERGGKVIFHGVTTSDLDALTRHYELVLVAAGKGELVQLFDLNTEWSPYRSPQRIVSVAYVHGVDTRPEHPDQHAVRLSAIPGIGELVCVPGYTFTGPCEMPYFEALPGGPLDCFDDRPGPAEHWSRMLELMARYYPWEYERFKNAELTDSNGILVGGVTPAVRHPVGQLPSGGIVMGMADVVVVNDPITGQGSNNASKSAASYLTSILERGDQPFDRDWMQRTFDRYFANAQHVVTFSQTMCDPLPDHIMNLFWAAADRPEIRTRFVNGFDDPAELEDWFIDQDKATEYLRQVTAAS